MPIDIGQLNVGSLTQCLCILKCLIYYTLREVTQSLTNLILALDIETVVRVPHLTIFNRGEYGITDRKSYINIMHRMLRALSKVSIISVEERDPTFLSYRYQSPV